MIIEKRFDFDPARNGICKVDVTIDWLVRAVENNEYVRLPKLLHGFWERVYHLCNGNVTLERLKKAVESVKDVSVSEHFEMPPQPSQYFNVHSTDGVDLHYYQIVDSMQYSKSKLIWGIHPEGYPDSTSQFHKRRRPHALAAIKAVGPRIAYDGTIWKQAIVKKEIGRLWEAIEGHVVVVMGMGHLKDLNKHFEFKKFHHFPVKMPLYDCRDAFLKEWEEFHEQFREPVVYLTQCSITGAWATSMLNLPNSFVFDMGRALDSWAPKDVRPSQPWLEKVDNEVS